MLPVTTLLLDIVVILVAARAFAAIARKLGQPPVIGEILAGIVLGPTVVGNLFGDGLFPMNVRPALTALADIGLVLFMFVVGLEIDQTLIRGKEKVAGGIAAGATLVPFGLAVVFALWVADDFAGQSRLVFVLFLATAMSVSAFPVMARILTDRHMHRTQLGGIVLAGAGVADVVAWVVLAVVIAMAGSGEGGQWKVALIVPFALIMFLVVRPLLRRLVGAFEDAGRVVTSGLLAVVLLGIVLSAWATEWMQVHFIFGAFLFGAVMPRQGAERLNAEILERIEQLAMLLLLPIFFVVAGLSVNLAELDFGNLGVLAAIFVVAMGGKMLGAWGGTRIMGMRGRKAGAVATLMNTRGLTELVILTVGLQKGILNATMYSLLLVMALVTTAATGPLLQWIYPGRLVARDIREAEHAALGANESYQVVAVVPDPKTGGPLSGLAARLVGGERPAEIVLAHLAPAPKIRGEVGSGLSSELAEQAERIDELEALAAQMHTEAVPSRVVSAFAEDVAAEMPALVASADVLVEVVVVGRDAPGYVGVRAESMGRLVTVMSEVDADAADPIAVRYADTAEGAVTAEMALRLALAADRPLMIVGGKQADAFAERLTGLDVAGVRSARSAPSKALVFATDTGGDDGPATEGDRPAHVLVRAEHEPAQPDWAAVVAAMRRPGDPSGMPEPDLTRG